MSAFVCLASCPGCSTHPNFQIFLSLILAQLERWVCRAHFRSCVLFGARHDTRMQPSMQRSFGAIILKYCTDVLFNSCLVSRFEIKCFVHMYTMTSDECVQHYRLEPFCVGLIFNHVFLQTIPACCHLISICTFTPCLCALQEVLVARFLFSKICSRKM